MITVLVIGPGLQKISMQSRLEFIANVIPKAVRYLEWMIIATGITGVLLAFVPISSLSANAAVLIAGVAFALLAAVIDLSVTTPSFKEMSSLANSLLKSGQLSPLPEMAAYEKNARAGSIAGTVLLLVVLVLMVVTGL